MQPQEPTGRKKRQEASEMTELKHTYPNAGDLAISCGAFLGFPDCKKEERKQTKNVRQCSVDTILVRCLFVADIIEFRN